ncbi:hypothetical protein [Salidesulfovibrio onnuriiensis]|uniref:hypothetical protein n=1 Tax=Salidesulfovibrio onnuriiensis TaxID=2583823 RepID=UPI0011C92CFD|nr:hypothetical protein [Salidesulfovibrio onnuriiensis]
MSGTKIDDLKLGFLRDVFFSNAWSAAVANRVRKTYVKGAKDNERYFVYYTFQDFLYDLEKKYVAGKVDEKEHLANIESLVERSMEDDLKSCLFKGKMTFGVAQKLLNMYLKYLWCAGIIKHEPPHCPIDSIVLRNLDIDTAQKSQGALPKWPDADEKTYNKYINKLNDKTNNPSQWELREWNEYSNKDKERYLR